MRRAAIHFGVSRTTIARKLEFLGRQAARKLEVDNLAKPLAVDVQFDDLETIENSKYRPLSVTLMVESGTRRILGFEVSQMPARGRHAKLALKKFGPREDKRREGRIKLFKRMDSLIAPNALIRSDKNPHYAPLVRKFFPTREYVQFKGRRGCLTAQGELKRGGFDPLFSLNHTCAMFRANVHRLFRKTWNTTKDVDRLRDQLAIYADYHNEVLIHVNKKKPTG